MLETPRGAQGGDSALQMIHPNSLLPRQLAARVELSEEVQCSSVRQPPRKDREIGRGVRPRWETGSPFRQVGGHSSCPVRLRNRLSILREV